MPIFKLLTFNYWQSSLTILNSSGCITYDNVESLEWFTTLFDASDNLEMGLEPLTQRGWIYRGVIKINFGFTYRFTNSWPHLSHTYLAVGKPKYFLQRRLGGTVYVFNVYALTQPKHAFDLQKKRDPRFNSWKNLLRIILLCQSLSLWVCTFKDYYF